jgi:hypothetical protein
MAFSLAQRIQERQGEQYPRHGRHLGPRRVFRGPICADPACGKSERIGRLAQPLQGALRVASVGGEVFTAEVVARVRATDEREILGLYESVTQVPQQASDDGVSLVADVYAVADAGYLREAGIGIRAIV